MGEVRPFFGELTTAAELEELIDALEPLAQNLMTALPKASVYRRRSGV